MSKTDQKATEAKADEEKKAADEKAAEEKKAPDEKAATEAEPTDEPVQIDKQRVKDLIDQIENRHGHRIMELVHRFEQEEGMQMAEGDETTAPKMTMAGVSCRLRAGPDQTLENWANAARRALLKAA
ncbi:hypothetical protein K3758_07530 [Sulfitobacter sp. W002]|uniref:hypothetical protein n=1 Tax=Sulfitobacter sp. W002 TaxID=2867024 RepID=UPI0021A54DDF|nr:hypothetical protein [Sulfitobacter sp. W002]UWR31345.1 hypothetical protein K3758_07530 [Sulfitobacter sp. W002]